MSIAALRATTRPTPTRLFHSNRYLQYLPRHNSPELQKYYDIRLSSIAPVAIAIAPAFVSAGGTLGFALGDVNPDGSSKQQSDYEADFDAIAANSAA